MGIKIIEYKQKYPLLYNRIVYNSIHYSYQTINNIDNADVNEAFAWDRTNEDQDFWDNIYSSQGREDSEYWLRAIEEHPELFVKGDIYIRKGIKKVFNGLWEQQVEPEIITL